MKNNRSIAALAALALLLLCSCADISDPPASAPASVSAPEQTPSPLITPAPATTLTPAPPSAPSGSATIRFDFTRQSGYASNQFAVWIEDADGDFVKTLYATRYTANGGYEVRPDSIWRWVERSDLENSQGVDAVSGATPQSESVSYVWDCTNADGTPIPAGKYRFFVEGSLRWKNSVLYTGEIEVGGAAAAIEATAEFIYEGSADQPALDASAVENGMIGPVTAVYEPMV